MKIIITGIDKHVDEIARSLRMHVARGIIKIETVVEDEEKKIEKSIEEDAKVSPTIEFKPEPETESKAAPISDTKKSPVIESTNTK